MKKIEEICEFLISKIYNNPTEQLPTENSLCIKFDVHRTTAREAFSILKMFNIVKATKGKGYFPVDNVKILLKGSLLSNHWFDEVKRIQVNDESSKKEIAKILDIKTTLNFISKSYYFEKNKLIKISFNVLYEKNILSRKYNFKKNDWLKIARNDNLKIEKISHEIKIYDNASKILSTDDVKALGFISKNEIPIIISSFVTDKQTNYETNIIFMPKDSFNFSFTLPFMRPANVDK